MSFPNLSQAELDLVGKALEALAAGKCPICSASIEPSRIIGRCRYGACGHRIGQAERRGRTRR